MAKKEKDVIQKFNDGDELTSAEKDFVEASLRLSEFLLNIGKKDNEDED